MKSKGIAIVLGLTVGLTAGYLISTTFMMDKMMPGTTINGADFSKVPRSELNDRLSNMEKDAYALTVRDIHGNETVITGQDIDLKAEFPIEEIRVQNPLIYPYYILNPGNFFVSPTSVSYDENKLQDIINNSVLPEKGSTEKPVNAFLTAYVPGEGYTIAQEVDGDTPDADSVSKLIKDAINDRSVFIDLASEDCYYKASVRSDDSSLNREAVSLNDALSASITYDFGNQKITLNSDTYYPWLITAEDGTVTLDEDKVDEYVTRLKSATDTAYTTRSFNTVSGRTISVKGPYGYNISKKKEAEQIKKDAYEEGYNTGHQEGMQDGRRAAQQQAEAEFKQTIEKYQTAVAHSIIQIGEERDESFHRYLDELKNVAIAVAEKVIHISLETSGEIIKRMIIAEVEKMKRTEWIKIYIDKYDYEQLISVDEDVANDLARISDNVKFIVQDKEKIGYAVIETPSEMIDIGVDSQIDNIRENLNGISLTDDEEGNE